MTDAGRYLLTGAGGRSHRSDTAGTLGGHRRSKIYGTLDCRGAAQAIARGGYVTSRVFFATEADAIAAGYRPCFVCLREKYREWRTQHP